MSLPFIFRTARQIALTVTLAVCSASLAMADPESYWSDTVVPVEPEMAAALPHITDPVQKIMHAVVVVEATARSGARTESTFGTNRKGTGVVIDSDGLIATAGYIVAEAESVKVTFTNGITDEAEIVAYDDSLGLGLLRPKNFRSTHALELGNSSDIKKEQKALILPASGEEGAQTSVVQHFFLPMPSCLVLVHWFLSI